MDVTKIGNYLGSNFNLNGTDFDLNNIRNIKDRALRTLQFVENDFQKYELIVGRTCTNEIPVSLPLFYKDMFIYIINRAYNFNRPEDLSFKDFIYINKNIFTPSNEEKKKNINALFILISLISFKNFGAEESLKNDYSILNTIKFFISDNKEYFKDNIFEELKNLINVDGNNQHIYE